LGEPRERLVDDKPLAILSGDLYGRAWAYVLVVVLPRPVSTSIAVNMMDSTLNISSSQIILCAAASPLTSTSH
jgi:hypothetical protein